MPIATRAAAPTMASAEKCRDSVRRRQCDSLSTMVAALSPIISGRPPWATPIAQQAPMHRHPCLRPKAAQERSASRPNGRWGHHQPARIECSSLPRGQLPDCGDQQGDDQQPPGVQIGSNAITQAAQEQHRRPERNPDRQRHEQEDRHRPAAARGETVECHMPRACQGERRHHRDNHQQPRAHEPEHISTHRRIGRRRGMVEMRTAGFASADCRRGAVRANVAMQGDEGDPGGDGDSDHPPFGMASP